jgi:hypothetical protein
MDVRRAFHTPLEHQLKRELPEQVMDRIVLATETDRDYCVFFDRNANSSFKMPKDTPIEALVAQICLKAPR